MSQENVEIVRGLYAAFARRDSEAPFEHYASDIEWDTSRVWAGLGLSIAHGHDGVRQMFRELLGAFREFDFEVVDT
jgi:ketosteroid isomerase-like protein